MRSQSPGRRTVGVVLAVVAATALSACTSDGASPTATETPTAPTTTPTATSSPTPELRPVVGDRRTTVRSASGNAVLGLGSDPKPKMAVIEDTFGQIGDWLDAHLDRLQRTGAGRLGEIAADGIGSKDERDPVTTHLASPDHPVKAARYDMIAYHAGRPQMVSVRVTVSHPDAEPTRASLGFVVADDGTPIMMMYAAVPAEG